MNDPLNNTDDAGRALFSKMTQVCSGFSHDQVISAAMNLVINSIRQSDGSQKKALDKLDEVNSRGRAALAEHYDSSGKRRNIFPHTQHVGVSLVSARAKINGHSS